jgi:hypothetical protein
MRRSLRLSLLAAVAAASACTSDDYRRGNGVTDGAGNAMYANTVLQMVDPWQRGVENTDLRVPAQRGTEVGAADEAVEDKASQTTTNN